MQRAKAVTQRIIEIYTEQRVPRSAAAMAYYFTISIFPVLIVAYAVLSGFNISQANLAKVLTQVIPADAADVIVDFLKYVGGNQSAFMVVVGIVVTLTSSSAAFRSLMRIMADIQGKPRYKGIGTAIYSLVLSLGLLAAIYASGLVIVSGEWLLSFLERSFNISLFAIWQWERFAALFIIMLSVIYLIYLSTAPREKTKVRRMPGAAIASVLLVAVSIIFSKLISMSANYPLVYGSLASFIILMFWVYICSIIVVMGNVFNCVVYHQMSAGSAKDGKKEPELPQEPAGENSNAGLPVDNNDGQ